MKGDEGSVNLQWDRMESGRAMDMQKVAMEIIWNATFTEAPEVKIKAETINLAFDEALTIAKKK